MTRLLTNGRPCLTFMPAPLVATIRDAWNAVKSTERCVVHGDAGAGNAIITPAGDLVLIDWDEARVDAPLYDRGGGVAAIRARLAWEIAPCWHREPGYARLLAREFSLDS